jgi:hypothetical protein
MMQTRANRVVDKRYSGISVDNSKSVVAITAINSVDGPVLEIEVVVSIIFVLLSKAYMIDV